MPDTVKVQFNQLWKADIIFTTSNARVSQVIRKATNSIISHTILVTDHNSVIEAIEPVVREDSWAVALDHAEATVAIVMRRKNLTNGADQDKIVAAARKFKGLPYDRIGAAGAGMTGSTRNQVVASVGCSLFPVGCAVSGAAISNNASSENADKSFFCSELVSRAFTIAGFPLVDGRATDANPNTVLISPYLNYVGHLVGG